MSRSRGRKTLLLIGAVCLAPVLAGYLLFWFWRPAGGSNYGELLPPAPWRPGALHTPEGRVFDPQGLRGRWVMVYAGGPACAERCRQALWTMRQVRTAQGKEMDRVERVWLVTGEGSPDPRLLAEHPGLRVLRASVADDPGRIALVDPQGHRMMRYPPAPEPRRMLRDLQRVLKYTRTG